MLIKEIKQNNLDLEADILSNRKKLISKIKNYKVLIIGGAGTIGASYTKEILKFKPKKIVIVDINENGLTELTRDLRSSKLLDYSPIFITYPVNLLSSVFDKIFYSDHFDIISNFSAHKHVRSEKDTISIEALINNNIFGAIKLLNLCSHKKPKYFFSVSTDKAANPVNIMGASKLIMEKVILSKKDKFRVSTARFANVAYSNGSLLDGFIHRINKKQPLSCPNDIKRFFVTEKQAGQICLLATFLEESGTIFFPKLDFHTDQIYFKDIAIDFLKKNNYEAAICKTEKEAKDFNIKNNHYPIFLFKTDTSGEKEYEEFYTDEEKFNINKYKSLGYIENKNENIDLKILKSDFEKIFKMKNLDKIKIIKILNKYIPNFKHIEKGKSLDQKM